MANIEKRFIDPQELMDNSLLLAQEIIDSGYTPDFIVAIWRGGTPIGIVIQELFEYLGMATDHIAIRTSYYTGLDQVADRVQVYGYDYLINNIKADDSLLIVDDVFDSGNSIKAVLDLIERKAGQNTPGEIRIATPYYKPLRKQTGELMPHYYVVETDDWLVFPHELRGLSLDEIAQHKSGLSDWLKNHKAAGA